MLLSGQKVVVVGGSSGIGLSTAELAKNEGAEVVIASRNAERLNAAACKNRCKGDSDRRHKRRKRWAAFSTMRSCRSCRRHCRAIAHRSVQDGVDG
jgi:NAD(P)-dependent dehydrogenase (short-subunit alcohol dehydrogenase family)